MEKTMKAVLIRPDKSLELSDVSYPAITDENVIIKIHAAGVNRADLLQREGNYPPPPGWPEWPGLEVSGEICEIGKTAKEKSSFRVGDRVCALIGGGGYAEYISTSYKTLIKLSDDVPYELAAGLPEVYATAYLNLFYEGGMKKGDTVCVFAGASGVGIAVTQIAKAFGAKVIATVRSDEKAKEIEKFGADVIVNTKKKDIAEVFEENGVDIVIDCVGGNDMGKCFSKMNMFGRWIVIATLGGNMSEIDLMTVYKKRLRIIGSTLRSRTDEEKSKILGELEEKILPLMNKGDFAPEIYKVFDIKDVEEAHKVVLDNKNIGKVILKLI